MGKTVISEESKSTVHTRQKQMTGTPEAPTTITIITGPLKIVALATDETLPPNAQVFVAMKLSPARRSRFVVPVPLVSILHLFDFFFHFVRPRDSRFATI